MRLELTMSHSPASDDFFETPQVFQNFLLHLAIIPCACCVALTFFDLALHNWSTVQLQGLHAAIGLLLVNHHPQHKLETGLLKTVANYTYL